MAPKIWFLVGFLICYGGIEATCTTFQCLQDLDADLALMRRTMKRLDMWLDDVDRSHQSFKKVLSAYGIETDTSKVTLGPHDPLESFLLQHQISMYQEIKKMVSDPPKPVDCSDILASGVLRSGVYFIYPSKLAKPVRVYCDMDTEGGGWTVLLSRKKLTKSVNFTRNWEDYKNGFGTPGEEQWLGNENLHILTSSRNYTLRLEYADEYNNKVWGEWNTFRVGSEKEQYLLTAKDPKAENTVYDDVLAHHNGNKFSTYDRENDRNDAEDCAKLYKGGWWYNGCFWINPTGMLGGVVENRYQKIRLFFWSKRDPHERTAARLQLKIRHRV